MDIFTHRKHLLDTLAWRVVAIGLDEITAEVGRAMQQRIGTTQAAALRRKILPLLMTMQETVEIVGTKRSW